MITFWRGLWRVIKGEKPEDVLVLKGEVKSPPPVTEQPSKPVEVESKVEEKIKEEKPKKAPSKRKKKEEPKEEDWKNKIKKLD